METNVSTRSLFAASACFGAALALVGCAPAPEAPIVVTAPPPVRPMRLDNGLVVVLDPDMTAISARVHVRYHVGAKDDPSGRAGLAHLVEHLTFEAPAHAGDKDRVTMLERIGAVDVNGSTSFDSTDFYATTPPSRLASALWVEASRMARPIGGLEGDALADGDVLRRELAVVDNELRTRASSDAYMLAHELLAESLFGKAHPYGRTANAARGELAAVTMAEARAFATLHYQPANATLVVSGRFDTEATTRLVSRYFGTIRSRPSAPREVFPAPALARNESATFSAPVRSRTIAMGWLFPPPETDGYDEMALAGSAIQGRLRGRLLGEGGVDDVRVHHDGGHLGSMLVVLAKPRAEANIDNVAYVIERVMSEVAALGRTFEWDTFGDVRLAVATSMVIGLESPAQRASRIQHDLEYAGVTRSTADEIARTQRLQPWDVGGAVKQFVADAHHATIVLEPDPAAPPGGRRR